MSVKTVVFSVLAVICLAPMSAEANFFGHRAAGCGCEAAPSCGCEVSCDPCAVDPCARGGRLRGLLGHRRGCCAPAPVCCEPAPVCCAPAPVCCEPAPVCCDPCNTCCPPRCGLVSRLQARRAARSACCPAPSCCEAAPSCGCGH